MGWWDDLVGSLTGRATARPSAARAVVDRGVAARGHSAAHPGVDIAAPEGTPVRAVANGVILCGLPVEGYGITLFVRYNFQPAPITLIYAHLAAPIIGATTSNPAETVANIPVRAGQEIGRVGRTTAGFRYAWYTHLDDGRVTARVLTDDMSSGSVRAISPHVHLEARRSATPVFGPQPTAGQVVDEEERVRGVMHNYAGRPELPETALDPVSFLRRLNIAPVGAPWSPGSALLALH